MIAPSQRVLGITKKRIAR